jgi:hypothetical protein
MQKEVTLQDLNRAYIKEMFKNRWFYRGLVLYILGLFSFCKYLNRTILPLIGSILMLIGVFFMMGANWNAHLAVMKRLRWAK